MAVGRTDRWRPLSADVPYEEGGAGGSVTARHKPSRKPSEGGATVRDALTPVAAKVNPVSCWYFRTKVARDFIARWGGWKCAAIQAGQVIALVTAYADKSLWSRRGYYGGLRWCLRVIGAEAKLSALVPSAQTSRCRTITAPDAEFARVLDGADPKLAFALILARYCGLRIGTILRLAPRHHNDGHIRITTKGGTWVSLPTTNRVEEALKGLEAICTTPDEPFLSQLGVRHPYQLARRLRAVQAEAKCAKLWTFHDLRRTFAQSMYQLERDLRVVQKAMGHKSPRHTLWYLDNPEVILRQSDMTGAEPKERKSA